MRAPSAGVPLPGGRPVPSGSTLMSQAAMSAGLIAFPRFGDWAEATAAVRASVSATANPKRLRVYMLQDRKSTRLNSSHMSISYAVFCLKKKIKYKKKTSQKIKNNKHIK